MHSVDGEVIQLEPDKGSSQVGGYKDLVYPQIDTAEEHAPYSSSETERRLLQRKTAFVD